MKVSLEDEVANIRAEIFSQGNKLNTLLALLRLETEKQSRDRSERSIAKNREKRVLAANTLAQLQSLLRIELNGQQKDGIV
jgi:hypothetical protein